MTNSLTPTTEQQLADALHEAADSKAITHLGGAFSKTNMAGRVESPQRTISTCAMRRLLQYEPRDLTISVEAGFPWRDLAALLAENRQTIPLDPPYANDATVGGVIAANTSGPRRRLYGSARDLVIGMRFATLEGKIVQTGGMVVKNVAGLDMAKLLIGSFGTLAAIASVNFKLIPLPLEHRTFVLPFATAAEAIAARDRVLNSPLQPAALDIVKDATATTLLIEAGGNAALMTRYEKELASTGLLDYDWTAIREFTPRYLAANPAACVARLSTTLTGLQAVLESSIHPILARAGNAIAFLHFPSPEIAAEWAGRAENQNWRFVFEYGIQRDSASFSADFAMMGKVKNLFDPQHILNPGRMYGRI